MKIYVVLTDTGTWFTKLIKCFTKKPLNHTSLSFDKHLYDVYSFGRKNPKNPFFGGFVKENMRGILFKKAACAVYSLDITESQFQRIKEFLLDVEYEKEKYRYNLLGLIYVLFHKECDRKYAYFCSEFVATALSRGGIMINNKSVHLTRPSDFAECSDLELVYEGPLSAYLLQTDTSPVKKTG